LLESFGRSQGTGNIASVFVDAARNFALGCFRAAPSLERARATVRGPCTIEKCLAVVDPTCRVEELAFGAHRP
jgi:hypothetical protein